MSRPPDWLFLGHPVDRKRFFNQVWPHMSTSVATHFNIPYRVYLYPYSLFYLFFVPFPTDDFPLHRAVHQKSESELRRLISVGESVNVGTFDCVTPLHDACIAGSVGCVRILVDAGAVVSVL